MLYNDSIDHDVLNILEHIDGFTVGIGLERTPVNTEKLLDVCATIRNNFPCVDGLDNASIFKRAAVFVACFVESGPIDEDSFAQSNLKDDIKSKNPNAIIALDIAFKFMSLARISRKDGLTLIIRNGIYLSEHSYCDFLDMLSKGITLESHFMVLSLLFEQVVYKTHSNMQYEVIDFAQETTDEIENTVYPSNLDSNIEQHPEWDDYVGFWSDIT